MKNSAGFTGKAKSSHRECERGAGGAVGEGSEKRRRNAKTQSRNRNRINAMRHRNCVDSSENTKQ